jgi:transposase InsO family protein
MAFHVYLFLLVSASSSLWRGSGWPSTLAPSFFPCFSWVIEPKTWHICSSTRSDRAWPLVASRSLPVTGSSSPSMRLSAHFGQWLQVPRRGRNVCQWQVAAGLIYWQVKKSYRRRKLVRVTCVMRLGTEDALTATLQGLGFSGRLNTAFIERVNLTIRHGVAALARPTWATSQQFPHLLAHLQWWRAYYHFVRPHHSLRVRLVQPCE